eukprot:gene24763-33238_t
MPHQSEDSEEDSSEEGETLLDTDEEDSYDSANDSAGSLEDFIAEEDESLTTTSATKRNARTTKKKLIANAQNHLQLVKRGRPAGVKNKSNDVATPSLSPLVAEKQPGDVSFPLTCWSLTVTRSGVDIHTSLLDNMNQFLHDGVFEMHYPPKLYQKLGKFIKKTYIPRRGVGHKVNVKALSKTQTFSAMIGYVTKDFDKAHYSVVSKGVSAQELTNGRREHNVLFTSHDESKRSYSPKAVNGRYHLVNRSSTSINDSPVVIDLACDASNINDNSSSSSSSEQPESLVPYEKTTVSSKSKSHSTWRQHLMTTTTEAADNEEDRHHFLCPSTLHEMLEIVRELKRQKSAMEQKFHFRDPATSPPSRDTESAAPGCVMQSASYKRTPTNITTRSPPTTTTTPKPVAIQSANNATNNTKRMMTNFDKVFFRARSLIVLIK